MFSLSFAVVAAIVFAASPVDAEALMEEGSQLLAAGRFAEAQKPLTAAVAAWKALGPNYEADFARAQNNLATAFRRQGQFERAIALLEEVVKAAEVAKVERVPRLRVSLNNLATAYMYAKRPAEARSSWERAIALAPKGAPDEELARELDNLATLVLDGGGDLSEADALLRRSTMAWLALRGKDDLDYGISLSVLGTVQMRREQYPAARKTLGQALKVQAKTLGPEHPDVGALLNLLGELEVRDGHPAVARPYFVRSLAIAKKSLEPNHPQRLEAEDGLRQTRP